MKNSTLIFFLVSLGACAQTDKPVVKNQSIDTPMLDVSIQAEPHPYGGWYCPDNFGFVPVNIQNLKEVPAISNRLPTELELKDHMSLINVDTKKHPDARALNMKLPRVARIYDAYKDMNELVIVIQAIVVQKDTVVGFRFPNGGNGSARIQDVTFLSENEVAAMGSQPFFYSNLVLNASMAEIWNAMRKTDYFNQLGQKFNEKEFFSSEYSSESKVEFKLDKNGEKAIGFVGLTFGNYYLQIDYEKDGFHYSEKMLMIENQADKTTAFYFACGPFPNDFDKQQLNWSRWVEGIKKASETK